MQLLSPSGSVINPGASINQAVVIANPNKVVEFRKMYIGNYT